jgi:hypothetical protein
MHHYTVWHRLPKREPDACPVKGDNLPRVRRRGGRRGGVTQRVRAALNWLFKVDAA